MHTNVLLLELSSQVALHDENQINIKLLGDYVIHLDESGLSCASVADCGQENDIIPISGWWNSHWIDGNQRIDQGEREQVNGASSGIERARRTHQGRA